MEDFKETKGQIRKRHLLVRNGMSQEERRRLSDTISEHARRLLELPEKSGVWARVYGYYPLGSEASLIPFYQYLLGQGVPLAFPRVRGISMDFFQVFSLDEFREGAFHVMEPEGFCKMAEWEDALCLTPGSVFDRAGGRFGYGKGYYDRYFEKHPGLLRAGIAYEHQVEENLPTESFDLPMDYLITEQGVFPCGKEQLWN